MSIPTSVPRLRGILAARPEHELLIRSARVSVDSETAARIRALVQGDLDWAYLLKAANGHGTQPLLYHCCPN
jgi:hypothetical protein